MTQTKILINTPTKIMLTNLSEIVMFTFDTKTRVWTVLLSDGTIYSLGKKTSSEKIIWVSDNLFQVNLRCIVNLDYVEFVEGKDVKLKGFDERVKITRYFLNLFNEKFLSV